ncbi:MAG: response regulator [Capsulimonadales bacterium]|nr:response regulator [Capsulimonadales bacterium]
MSETTPRLKALICEDEGMTVILLQRALQAAGYEVVGKAVEGAQAVELARSTQPDFILMDINMPGMNGIESTRLITAERSVPIIMLTAYSEDKRVDEAIDAGACAYLVKPITSTQLIPSLRTALARFEALNDIRKENQDLKDQLETRKLVERAKGILQQRTGLTEADAFKRIQKVSRDKCQPMRQTAHEIIEADSLFS